MMKNECPIVKDLMPLYIDGAVCSESRDFMAEHIAHCPTCAEYYGEMKTEFRFRNAQQEKAAQEELEKAALRVKQRRERRRLLLALISLILGVVLCLAGLEWYNEYFFTYSQPLSSQEYSFKLYRSDDGMVVGLFDLQEDTLDCLPEVNYFTLEDDTLQMDVTLHTTRKRAYVEPDDIVRKNVERTQRIGKWENGLWETEGKFISRIVVHYSDQDKVVYQANWYIPFCSDELRAYYRFADSAATKERLPLQEYLREMLRLRDQVPEWQVDAATDD